MQQCTVHTLLRWRLLCQLVYRIRTSGRLGWSSHLLLSICDLVLGHHIRCSCCINWFACSYCIPLDAYGAGLDEGEGKKLITEKNGGDMGRRSTQNIGSWVVKRGRMGPDFALGHHGLVGQGGNNNGCMHTNYRLATGYWLSNWPITMSSVYGYIRPAIPTKSSKSQSQKKNSPSLSSSAYIHLPATSVPTSTYSIQPRTLSTYNLSPPQPARNGISLNRNRGNY